MSKKPYNSEIDNTYIFKKGENMYVCTKSIHII